MLSKVQAVTEKMEEIINILEIPLDENSKETPARIARMWVNETMKNMNKTGLEKLREDFKCFPNETSVKIVMLNINFSSLCMHHFMPFFGQVDIEIIPDEKIAGLSKLPRVVDYFSRMPQLQEYLTQNIADFLFEELNPKKVVVRIKAQHTCVMCRGIENFGSETLTEVEKLRGDYNG